MKGLTIIAFLALCCCACITESAEAAGPDAQSRIQMRVQEGDTWPGLFGNDWQDDWQRVEAASGGKSCWCVGSLLTIPPNVHLADQALDRLPFMKDRRDHLRQRLEALTQAGGDIAASAERLHGQLDAAISMDDLSNLDTATIELENSEIQTANEASAEVWIIIGGTAFVLLVTMLLMWLWWNRAVDGVRRLDAALRMVDTIAG
jgi:hypothetical protein